jgi:hypothetical protein
MYVGLMILDRLQYIQDTNVPKHNAFEADMDIEMLKDVSHQGLFIFEQNVFVREVEEYVLRWINSLILFGIVLTMEGVNFCASLKEE